MVTWYNEFNWLGFVWDIQSFIQVNGSALSWVGLTDKLADYAFYYASGDNLGHPNCMVSSAMVPGGPVSAVGLLDGWTKVGGEAATGLAGVAVRGRDLCPRHLSLCLSLILLSHLMVKFIKASKLSGSSLVANSSFNSSDTPLRNIPCRAVSFHPLSATNMESSGLVGEEAHDKS